MTDNYIDELQSELTGFITNVSLSVSALTPVDTGNLISSFHIDNTEDNGIKLWFDTKQAPYAIYVHENLYCKHPNGGQAKFLQDAVEQTWLDYNLSDLFACQAVLSKEELSYTLVPLTKISKGEDIQNNEAPLLDVNKRKETYDRTKFAKAINVINSQEDGAATLKAASEVIKALNIRGKHKGHVPQVMLDAAFNWRGIPSSKRAAISTVTNELFGMGVHPVRLETLFKVASPAVLTKKVLKTAMSAMGIL